MPRPLRVLVSAGWLGALLWLLGRQGGSMRLVRFLSPNLAWLLVVGAVGAALFLAVSLVRRPHGAADLPMALVQFGLLALPLAYLPSAYAHRLGAQALLTRRVKAPPRTAPSPAPLPPVPKPARLESAAPAKPEPAVEATVIQLTDDEDAWRGKRVVVEGMVSHDPELPDGTFMVYRFIITCCVADARVAGVVVTYDKAKTLEAETWVRLEGTVGAIDIEGEQYPQIILESVKTIEEPPEPYLY
ncbi:TIGR03943 family protein, partial [bacterium]|nr:TIGR03943 family protein [bacterium]